MLALKIIISTAIVVGYATFVLLYYRSVHKAMRANTVYECLNSLLADYRVTKSHYDSAIRIWFLLQNRVPGILKPEIRLASYNVIQFVWHVRHCQFILGVHPEGQLDWYYRNYTTHRVDEQNMQKDIGGIMLKRLKELV